jgi:hypothetical protein
MGGNQSNQYPAPSQGATGLLAEKNAALAKTIGGPKKKKKAFICSAKGHDCEQSSPHPSNLARQYWKAIAQLGIEDVQKK